MRPARPEGGDPIVRRAGRREWAARPGSVRPTLRGVALLVASAIAFIAAYALGFRQLLYVAVVLAALPLIALALVRVRRPKRCDGLPSRAQPRCLANHARDLLG